MDSFLTVRIGTESDIPSVISLIDGVVPVMNANGNYQWEVGKYPVESDFRRDLSLGWMYVCVNKSDEVVGVAALTNEQPDNYGTCGWDISIEAIVPHRVATRIDQQGKGVGQTLLNYACILAKERGLAWVRIDTNSANKAMQHTLTKLGFSFKGEIQLEGKPPDMMFHCFEKAVV